MYSENQSAPGVTNKRRVYRDVYRAVQSPAVSAVRTSDSYRLIVVWVRGCGPSGGRF